MAMSINIYQKLAYDKYFKSKTLKFVCALLLFETFGIITLSWCAKSYKINFGSMCQNSWVFSVFIVTKITMFLRNHSEKNHCNIINEPMCLFFTPLLEGIQRWLKPWQINLTSKFVWFFKDSIKLTGIFVVYNLKDLSCDPVDYD